MAIEMGRLRSQGVLQNGRRGSKMIFVAAIHDSPRSSPITLPTDQNRRGTIPHNRWGHKPCQTSQKASSQRLENGTGADSLARELLRDLLIGVKGERRAWPERS